MNQYVTQGGIKIAHELHQFIEQEVLPGLELDADQYWANLETLLNEFAPRNKALLAKRDAMQLEIDNYHRASEGKAIVPEDYEQFLRRIHYLEEDVDHFEIETSGVDPEIAVTAGPQLVVPIMNARFALNAANARWGSSTRSMGRISFLKEQVRRRDQPITLSEVTSSSRKRAQCSMRWCRSLHVSFRGRSVRRGRRGSFCIAPVWRNR